MDMPHARRVFIQTSVLALALAAATAGLAAEDKKPTVDDRAVDISPVGLPIVWNGAVINYVFVKVRLKVGPAGDPSKLRLKEPFFRDALVRAGHSTPFIVPWEFTKVDEPAIARAMMIQSARIAGPGQITGVVVTGQTPQRRSGLPRKPAPNAKPQPAPSAES